MCRFSAVTDASIPPNWKPVGKERRTAIAEGVIMEIAGWYTRSLFERYTIVSQTDIAEALKNLESFVCPRKNTNLCSRHCHSVSSVRPRNLLLVLARIITSLSW
jgi:hypothetical protein